MLASRKPDLRQRAFGKASALTCLHATIDQWQFDIFNRRGPGKQIEALEHETQHVAAQERVLAAVQP